LANTKPALASFARVSAASSSGAALPRATSGVSGLTRTPSGALESSIRAFEARTDLGVGVGEIAVGRADRPAGGGDAHETQDLGAGRVLRPI